MLSGMWGSTLCEIWYLVPYSDSNTRANCETFFFFANRLFWSSQAMVVQERNDLTIFIPNEKKKSKQRLVEQRRDTLWRTLLSEKTKMERVMRAQQEAEEAKTTSRQAALAEARALKAAAANLQQDAPQVCDDLAKPEPEPAAVVAPQADKTANEESALGAAETVERARVELELAGRAAVEELIAVRWCRSTFETLAHLKRPPGLAPRISTVCVCANMCTLVCCLMRLGVPTTCLTRFLWAVAIADA